MTCFWRGTKSKVKTDMVDYESSVKAAYWNHINGTLVAFVSMKVTVWLLGVWARCQLSACAVLFDEGWASDFRPWQYLWCLCFLQLWWEMKKVWERRKRRRSTTRYWVKWVKYNVRPTTSSNRPRRSHLWTHHSGHFCWR